MRCSPAEFRALPLEGHARVGATPLRDVTVVDLPGGGAGRTIADVRALFPDGVGAASNFITRALFGLRWLLGRVFGWDEAPNRGFTTVFERADETLIEARNATVHAYIDAAIAARDDGYRLYFAVFVENTSWLTPIYMAAIEPWRRWVVYPSLARAVVRRWRQRYGRR
jgi:hypothetical protein